jgi:hypothetical protein
MTRCACSAEMARGSGGVDGADQCALDLAAVLGIAKEGPQPVDDMLEADRAKASRFPPNKADDVGGTDHAEINVVAAEAVGKEVAGEAPVAADRSGGQTSLMLQVLREAGRQFIGGRDGKRWGNAQALRAQVPQQLANGWWLVASRRVPAVTSTLIRSAQECLHMRVLDLGKTDALHVEPGIELSCAPGLGAHTDYSVALIDQ